MTNTPLVRAVNREDSHSIWVVRFDPSVNAQSLTEEIVPFEKHNEWFSQTYFTGRDNFCFVLVDTDRVIGYCRLDGHEREVYTVSIALDSRYRGKGLGSLLLSEVMRQVTGEKKYRATIKKDNISSIKLFEKNGFTICGEDAQNYILEKI